jgi:N-acetylglucosamine-6-sulfatase
VLLGALLGRSTALGADATPPSSRGASAPRVAPLPRLPGGKPRNVIFILADDHRFDAMGVAGHPWVETPHMDALGRAGAHMPNAFVTTALCSPSRASILTGLYAHKHGVVDNNNPIPPGTIFFPQYLQRSGYATAFFGKWHMGGEGDEPQPGFDRWVSFPGQGTYLPTQKGLNVDGRRVPQKGYVTDELTDYAVDWIERRPTGKPFFVYLSHKGVHAEFEPAARHKGRYRDKPFAAPKTMAAGAKDGRPMWVQNQRNSWHGVEFAYHGELDVADYYRRYMETLLAVDDSVGRVVEALRKRGELASTLIIYMGDNGFGFGEHGLIDKRTAYEESMRVPLVLACPELFAGGQRPKDVVANIDVAPTILEAAGLRPPAHMQGRSFLPVLRGRPLAARDGLLYEYYWERNFPHTPTIFALRDARYKYIRPHGVWDLEELYDLDADPLEAHNLIASPAHRSIVANMNRRLFDLLRRTGGMSVPLYEDRGHSNNLRRKGRSGAAPFPDELTVERGRAAAGNN